MRYPLIFILGVVVGFFLHAFFFPELFVNLLTPAPDLPNQTQTSQKPAVQRIQNVTTIAFDGKKFSHHAVTMEVSRYLVVINKSTDTLMWLTSNNADLTTKRGYGYLEQAKTRIDEKGQVIVADTNNPKERVVITVK